MSYIVKSDIEKADDDYVADKDDFIKSQPAAEFNSSPLVSTSASEVETKPLGDNTK